MKKAPPTQQHLETIELPAPEDEQPPESVAPEDAQQGPLVLVADDSVDNLLILSLDLQANGYRVVTASNGEEAFEVASLTRPALILMDIAMPVLDGLGAGRRIRQHPDLQHIPIIAVSAFDTDGFLRAAHDVGFQGYLTKPVDLERLRSLMRSMLPLDRQ